MKQVVNETEVHSTKDINVILRNISNVLFGTIEFFLVMRLLLMLFGASTNNAFVDFVYSITNYIVTPFKGIIANIDLSSNNIFEPATVIALIIVAFIAWIIMILLSGGITGKKVETTEEKEFLS
jgi:hypothetical protein